MKKWIILDSGSTVNLFCNPDIFNNIKESDDEIQVETNEGVNINNEKAEFPQYGEVRYD